LSVAVMLSTGSEFFAAFYGALYAGCVPADDQATMAAAQEETQYSLDAIRNHLAGLTRKVDVILAVMARAKWVCEGLSTSSARRNARRRASQQTN
jgi:acyl-CoA synthetase (AMP-forming)/AMP-acid ligase II